MIIRIAFTISYEQNVLFAIAYRKFLKKIVVVLFKKILFKTIIPVQNVVYTYLSVKILIRCPQCHI